MIKKFTKEIEYKMETYHSTESQKTILKNKSLFSVDNVDKPFFCSCLFIIPPCEIVQPASVILYSVGSVFPFDHVLSAFGKIH